MQTAELQLVENELLARLKAGDQAMFEHFYNKCWLQLYHKIMKMVGIDIIAKKRLQYLFAKIWQKRELINPEKSFKLYLYIIAENLIPDHLHQAVHQLKIERNTHISGLNLAEPIEEIFPKDLALKAICEAMKTLPLQQQSSPWPKSKKNPTKRSVVRLALSRTPSTPVCPEQSNRSKNTSVCTMDRHWRQFYWKWCGRQMYKHEFFLISLN